MSMRELFKGRLTHKFCGCLFVGSSSFILVLMMTCLSTQAAGCGGHSGQWSGGSSDGIAKIYENGRFYYYKVVPPCPGPRCGRQNPSSVTSLPPIIANERSNSLTWFTAYPDCRIPQQTSSKCADLQLTYVSPFFETLLRPPV